MLLSNPTLACQFEPSGCQEDACVTVKTVFQHVVDPALSWSFAYFYPIQCTSEAAQRLNSSICWLSLLSIALHKDSLAFTYCQVPIIYKKSTEAAIEVVLHSGESKLFSGQYLDKETSQQIFQRTNTINKIIVSTLKA